MSSPASRAHKRSKNRKSSNDVDSNVNFAGSDREALVTSNGLAGHKPSNLKGDYLNICVLLFLYVLQGWLHRV